MRIFMVRSLSCALQLTDNGSTSVASVSLASAVVLRFNPRHRPHVGACGRRVSGWHWLGVDTCGAAGKRACRSRDYSSLLKCQHLYGSGKLPPFRCIPSATMRIPVDFFTCLPQCMPRPRSRPSLDQSKKLLPIPTDSIRNDEGVGSA